MSGKLLLKLEVVSLMLQHHTSSAFHFLDHPVNGRNRWAGAGSCSGGGGGGGAGGRGALSQKSSQMRRFSAPHELTRYGRTERVPVRPCNWAHRRR
jgi:hypothetical protein